jgi:hypothetical protein
MACREGGLRELEVRGLPGGQQNTWLTVAPLMQLTGNEHHSSRLRLTVTAPSELRKEVRRGAFTGGVFALGTAPDSQNVLRPVGSFVASTAVRSFTTAHDWHVQQVLHTSSTVLNCCSCAHWLTFYMMASLPVPWQHVMSWLMRMEKHGPCLVPPG